jgi:hypothetical protein
MTAENMTIKMSKHLKRTTLTDDIYQDLFQTLLVKILEKYGPKAKILNDYLILFKRSFNAVWLVKRKLWVWFWLRYRLETLETNDTILLG